MSLTPHLTSLLDDDLPRALLATLLGAECGFRTDALQLGFSPSNALFLRKGQVWVLVVLPPNDRFRVIGLDLRVDFLFDWWLKFRRLVDHVLRELVFIGFNRMFICLFFRTFIPLWLFIRHGIEIEGAFQRVFTPTFLSSNCVHLLQPLSLAPSVHLRREQSGDTLPTI
jgi:hypothetical protein